jgi:hypothetical protein
LTFSEKGSCWSRWRAARLLSKTLRIQSVIFRLRRRGHAMACPYAEQWRTITGGTSLRIPPNSPAIRAALG